MKQQNYFHVGNKILDLGLSLTALHIFVYMISLAMANKKCRLKYCIVKQATIAAACGISTRQTVARAVKELIDMGLITETKRMTKVDGKPGTTIYILNLELLGKSSFKVDRDIFTQKLSHRGFKAFLFTARSICVKRKLSWNSYNDIADNIGCSRSDSVNAIKELISMKVIHRSRNKGNGRYYDNIYRVLVYVPGTIKRQTGAFFAKKKNSTGSTALKNDYLKKVISTFKYRITEKLDNVKGYPLDFFTGGGM